MVLIERIIARMSILFEPGCPVILVTTLSSIIIDRGMLCGKVAPHSFTMVKGTGMLPGRMGPLNNCVKLGCGIMIDPRHGRMGGGGVVMMGGNERATIRNVGLKNLSKPDLVPIMC